MPSWIPSFAAPVHPFTLQPPPYQKITSVIQRIKASSSPSLLDRISIICFKRCPYLRSVLMELIKNIWSSGCIPSEWKKACTILIHKKGETNDPANFRPIALNSVGLEIFTSCLCDSIFDFLKINGFVENKIYKGFTHKVSGTLESTAMMGNIINKARIKQRSVVITLLDLKNAFGMCIIILLHSFLPTMIYLKASNLLSQVFIPTSKHLLSWIITNFQPFLSAGESCKVIASALYFLTCASTLSFSSLKQRNSNNLAFLRLKILIACSIQCTGFSLLMMQQLLQVVKLTISCS